MDDLDRARELRRASEEAPTEVGIDAVLDLVRRSDREVKDEALGALRELARNDGERLAGRIDELAALLEDDDLHGELLGVFLGVSLEAPLLVTESLVAYLADETYRDRALSVLATAPPYGPVPAPVLPYRDALLEAASTGSSRGAAITVLAALADDYPEAVTEAVPPAAATLAADDEPEEAPLRLLGNVARVDAAAVRPAVPELRDHLRRSDYPPNSLLLEALYHIGLSDPGAVEPIEDRLRDLAEPACPEERQPMHCAAPARARNVLAVLDGGT